MDSLARRCAGLFVVGFPGQAPDGDVLRLIDDGVAGVILFRRNIEGAAQVHGLVDRLKRHAGRPLLACVDQEGGRVARLRGPPFSSVPAMRELGVAGDEARAEAVGRLLAYECRAVGFDLDFAPVVDVDTNPANPVIGDRSFSADASVVARLGVAVARGLEAGGVASSAKHFPGHGDTAVDSHLDLPSLPHDVERLRAVELVPFAAYARAGQASVMTAHVVFEAMAPGVPATMSREVISGLLRGELGFAGVVVSDDLEMKAISRHFTVEQAAVAAVQAGVDLLLVCHSASVQRRAIEAVAEAVRRKELPEASLEAALGRVGSLVSRFVRPAPPWDGRLGGAAHQALVQAALGGAVAGAVGIDPTERSG